jgi:serine protease Do
VSIVAVEANSEAADKGLQPGSVILSVSGEPVSTPEEVTEQAEAARRAGREAVLLLVREGTQERFVALRLETEQG